MSRRRVVVCWFCGKRARRVPSLGGLWLYWQADIHSDGKLPVVGRRRGVRAYGVCGATLKHGLPCPEPMLRPADAAYVLRAALQNERRGGNG